MIASHAEATVLCLVRHAPCDPIGVSIAGREGAVPLNEAGRRQASALAERLVEAGCTAMYSSPIQRALETAACLSDRLGLDVRTDEAFTEIDFGSWSGASIAQLSDEPLWQRFNEFRSWTAIPDGELIARAQTRAVMGILRLRARHPGERVIVITHAEIIRALVSYAAGTPLDLMLRFDCDPASVSVLSIGDGSVRILRVNDTGTLRGL